MYAFIMKNDLGISKWSHFWPVSEDATFMKPCNISSSHNFLRMFKNFGNITVDCNIYLIISFVGICVKQTRTFTCEVSVQSRTVGNSWSQVCVCLYKTDNYCQMIPAKLNTGLQICRTVYQAVMYTVHSVCMYGFTVGQHQARGPVNKQAVKVDDPRPGHAKL